MEHNILNKFVFFNVPENSISMEIKYSFERFFKYLNNSEKFIFMYDSIEEDSFHYFLKETVSFLKENQIKYFIPIFLVNEECNENAKSIFFKVPASYKILLNIISNYNEAYENIIEEFAVNYIYHILREKGHGGTIDYLEDFLNKCKYSKFDSLALHKVYDYIMDYIYLCSCTDIKDDIIKTIYDSFIEIMQEKDKENNIEIIKNNFKEFDNKKRRQIWIEVF